MEYAAESSNKISYIMVQLPENLDNSFAAAANDSKKTLKNAISLCDKLNRPHILTEIAKERIRRAGKKILEERGQASLLGSDAALDTGFRVFKVDDTNMKDVKRPAAEYTQEMLPELESNIKDDRTDLDLFFGSILAWGVPLSLPYKSEDIDGCTVHNYSDGELIACFDENIPDSVIKFIAKAKPKCAVFRDSSFAGSPERINVEEIFKLLAPETDVKVL